MELPSTTETRSRLGDRTEGDFRPAEPTAAQREQMLDGDGLVDLVFGAPYAEGGNGAVYVVPGSTL